MLHLHIGRGKAGSTTIQHFMRKNRRALKARGVRAITPGRRGPHADLRSGLFGEGDPDGTLESLIEETRLSPSLTYVISDETLLESAELTQARRLLETSGHEFQLIVYIREYGAWLRSKYGQGTKKVISGNDFDRFYQKRGTRTMSVMPRLRLWAEFAGWDRVRVRSLDVPGWSGDSLITDFLDAIGLGSDSGLDAGSPPKNVSLNWMELEFRRALATAFPARGRNQDLVESLIDIFATHVAESDNRDLKASYLSLDQAREANAAYEEDVREINSLTGSEIPEASSVSLEPRPFLPSIAHVPSDIIDAFLRDVGPEFAAGLEDEDREGLDRLTARMREPVPQSVTP
jgi:hypothetical protein